MDNNQNNVNVKIELEINLDNKKYSFEEVKKIIGNMDSGERYKLVADIKKFFES